jgi:hypothetical protein
LCAVTRFLRAVATSAATVSFSSVSSSQLKRSILQASTIQEDDIVLFSPRKKILLHQCRVMFHERKQFSIQTFHSASVVKIGTVMALARIGVLLENVQWQIALTRNRGN